MTNERQHRAPICLPVGTYPHVLEAARALLPGLRRGEIGEKKVSATEATLALDLGGLAFVAFMVWIIWR